MFMFNTWNNNIIIVYIYKEEKMKYIYDIMLNFNEKFYDFFEWNENDLIEYVKKILVFKVSNDVINDLKNNDVIVNNNFVNDLCDKTEIYLNTSIGNIEYACLFASDDLVIAIEFNDKGKVIYKSDLLIDEALDVISISSKLKEIKVIYKILKKNDISFKTREEIKKIDFIDREIDMIYQNNNIEKLKYLYYECYNKLEDTTKIMVNNLKKYDINDKLYDLLMLSYLK